MIRYRAVPEVIARVEKTSGNWERAEGREIDQSETARRLMMIGLAIVERCPACVAGLPCALHGAEATRATGEPVKRAKRGEVPSGYAETVEVYFSTFKEARGVAPGFMDREGAAMRTLLAAVGSERAQEAIRNAYADQWWRTKATINTIASDPSRHLGKIAPSTQASGKPSTLQRESSNGPTFKQAREIEV